MLYHYRHHISILGILCATIGALAVARRQTDRYANDHASAGSVVDMSVSNTVFPSNVHTGQSVVFLYFYQNEGGYPVQDITLRTTIPHGMHFVSSNTSYTRHGDEIVWTNLSGNYGVILLELAANNDVSGLLTNTVYVETTEQDIYTHNNSYVAAVNVLGSTDTIDDTQGDLSIEKKADKNIVAIGQEIHYTLTVTNNDTSTPATDIIVIDTLPDGVVFVSGSNDKPIYYQSGNTLVWHIDTLQANQNTNISFAARVSTLVEKDDTLMNFATVSTHTKDINIANNVGFVTNTLSTGEVVDIAVSSMQFANTSIEKNISTTLNIIVENAGPDIAKNTVLTLMLPDGIIIDAVYPTPSQKTGNKFLWELEDIESMYMPLSIQFKAATPGNKTFTGSIQTDTDDFYQANNQKIATISIVETTTKTTEDNQKNMTTSSDTMITSTSTLGHKSASLSDNVVDQKTNTENIKKTLDNLASSLTEKSCVEDSTVLYNYANKNNLTSMLDSKTLRVCDPITRIEFAKFITEYTLHVAGLTPDDTRVCNYKDMQTTNREDQNYAKTACKLGLMGLGYDGSPAEIFDPNTHISRAMVSTILSRLLFGSTYNGNAACWYCDHMQALKNSGVLKMIGEPTDNLLRGYALLMLMRADINGVVQSAIKIRNTKD